MWQRRNRKPEKSSDPHQFAESGSDLGEVVSFQIQSSLVYRAPRGFQILVGFWGRDRKKKILIFICFVYFIKLNLIKLYLPFGSETVNVKPGVQGSRRTITKHSFNFIFNPTCKPLALSPISKAPSGPRGPCLVTRHTHLLTGPHPLPCSHCFLHLFFFLLFFSVLLKTTLSQAWGCQEERKQSFFSRSYQEGIGDHRQVTGVAGAPRAPQLCLGDQSVAWRRDFAIVPKG